MSTAAICFHAPTPLRDELYLRAERDDRSASPILRTALKLYLGEESVRELQAEAATGAATN